MTDDVSPADGDYHVAVQWWLGEWQHRILTKQLPGSAHWSVIKETRGPGGKWERDWATESAHRPEVNPIE